MREYIRNEGTNQTAMTRGGNKKEETKAVRIEDALENEKERVSPQLNEVRG